MKTFCCFLGVPLVLPTIYYMTRTIFEVDKNCFALVIEKTKEGRKTEIYGPGYHVLGFYCDLDGIYSFKDQNQNNII